MSPPCAGGDGAVEAGGHEGERVHGAEQV
jgi:hypothetical protein